MYNHDKNSNSKYVLSHNSNGNIEFIEHPNVKWYQKENNARLLSQDFYKHILILRIIYNIEGNEHVAFFTGSPLLYKDKYLWLSGGHVIKIIQEMVYNNSYKIRGMSWFDNYEKEDAEAIPIGNYESLFNFSVDNKNKGDIGIVKLDELTIHNLKANKNLQWLDEHMWKNIDKAQPDGYYLVGTPYEMTKTKIERLGNKFKGKSDIYIICVPIERVESDIQKEPKEFWDYPDFIFGKIIQVHNQDGELLQNIEGMSGGLIFSVEIENINASGTSGIRYRLFGIQSSWLPNSQIIRATPIDNVVDYLEENIDKLN